MLSLCIFACVTGILGSTARHCANRHGDPFHPKACGVLAVAGALVAAIGRPSPAVCIVLGCVIVCAATDLSSGYVYNAITYPTFCLLLGIAIAAGTLNSALLWASIALAASLALYAFPSRRGLGLGDVKLFTVIALGVHSAVSEVLAGSFIIAACCVGIMMMRGRISFGETVPFAPFIAIATIADVPYRWAVR